MQQCVGKDLQQNMRRSRRKSARGARGFMHCEFCVSAKPQEEKLSSWCYGARGCCNECLCLDESDQPSVQTLPPSHKRQRWKQYHLSRSIGWQPPGPENILEKLPLLALSLQVNMEMRWKICVTEVSRMKPPKVHCS